MHVCVCGRECICVLVNTDSVIDYHHKVDKITVLKFKMQVNGSRVIQSESKCTNLI